MKTAKKQPCKRPYSLGKRLVQSDQKRVQILAAARSLLEKEGFLALTLDVLARESGVTRQTIHNLFGTKAGVIEALFDQIAFSSGLERMRSVMQQANPETMLEGFVDVFSGFWMKNRLLFRRIHGIGAIDPELGAAVQARNQRRFAAATRIIHVLQKQPAENEAQKIAALHALTSFEFFDALAESCKSAEEATLLLPAIVKNALGLSAEIVSGL